MFELTEVQKKAATHAMGGITPANIEIVLIFLLSTLVLTWLLVVSISSWGKLQQGQLAIGDVLMRFAGMIFIVGIIGWLIR